MRIIYIFIVISVVILFVIIKTIYSNHKVRIEKNCRIVNLREQAIESSNKKRYTITFEFENSYCKELTANFTHNHLMKVGDKGELVYQGKRLLEFHCIRER